MGLRDLIADAAKDAATDKALNVAEDKFVGEEKESGGCTSNILRFFISLIWFIVIIGVDILAFVVFNPIIGAVLEFIIFIITFCTPYLREKGSSTRWWGWLALLSAISLLGFAFGV